MIRLATIGTSRICSLFLEGAKLTNQFTLSAVYSRSYDRGYAFAEKFGCKNVFTNLSEMAQSDSIDAVYIASPNSLHYSQSKLFLQNGKHVICEKPVVTNSNEYTELKNLADKNNLIYMEAIMPLYTEHYSKVKSAFEKIGKIKSACFEFYQLSSRWDAFLKGEQVNIFNMSLHAGTLMDLGVYCVYAAIDFFGMPKSITACAEFLHNGADSKGRAVFEYDDFSATLNYCKNIQGNRDSEITGSNGTLKISSVSQYTGVTLVTQQGSQVVVEAPSRQTVMSGEAQAFADFILAKEQNIHKYKKISDMALNVHRCMDQIKNKAHIKYGLK